MRIDADSASLFRTFELHLTCGKCEQSEVCADSDVDAGPELVALLSNEDVASNDDFASVLLDAAALGIAIATVSG